MILLTPTYFQNPLIPRFSSRLHIQHLGGLFICFWIFFFVLSLDHMTKNTGCAKSLHFIHAEFCLKFSVHLCLKPHLWQQQPYISLQNELGFTGYYWLSNTGRAEFKKIYYSTCCTSKQAKCKIRTSKRSDESTTACKRKRGQPVHVTKFLKLRTCNFLNQKFFNAACSKLKNLLNVT